MLTPLHCAAFYWIYFYVMKGLAGDLIIALVPFVKSDGVIAAAEKALQNKDTLSITRRQNDKLSIKRRQPEYCP